MRWMTNSAYETVKQVMATSSMPTITALSVIPVLLVIGGLLLFLDNCLISGSVVVIQLLECGLFARKRIGRRSN
jgi:hypothetical protein